MVISEETDLFRYILRRSNDEVKLLFWEMDAVMIGLMDMLAGIDSGFPVTGLFLGIGAAFFYRKPKVGKHPDIATHFLYWLTGFSEPKELPGSYIRELNG